MNRIRQHITYPVTQAKPEPVEMTQHARALWTPAHDDVVRKYYARLGSEAVAERLGRPVKSVQVRAQALGVRRA